MTTAAGSPSGRAERGFSLIELMIVLIVLAFGIFGVARLFPVASRSMLRDRLRTEAVYYAQQKVETLRTLQANDPDLGAGRHPAGTATESVGKTGQLQRSWTVSQMPSPLDNVQRLDVCVTWNDPAGVDSVVSTSYVNH